MSSNGKEDGTPGKPKPEKGNSEVKKSSDEHCNKKNGGDDFMTRMGAGLRDLNVDDPSGGGRETKSVPAGVKGKNRTDSLEDDPGFIASMEKVCQASHSPISQHLILTHVPGQDSIAGTSREAWNSVRDTAEHDG